MCTVSWIQDETGYHLLCNRDEKRTRLAAIPPQVHVCDGIRFIAPLDADFRGTWIGVNEFGVTLALLNGSGQAHGRRSRGLLVLDALTSRSAPEAADHITSGPLELYKPFSLVALGREPIILRWDGQHLTYSSESTLLTSSSFDDPGAREKRVSAFATGGYTLPGLFGFHASHQNGPSAYSTCMHRDDAQTVSFSHVTVTHGTVQFTYQPGAPCETRAHDRISLALA